MTVVMLRLRVELEDVAPPIWRTVEVPVTLMLDALHLVVQGAMGWTNSHLHRFFTAERWDPDARGFASAEDLAEGDDGVPESGVSVGDVLREVGDELLYTYDFGDGWDHVVRVEGTSSSADGAVHCLDGRRACPPEDCGGAPGYEELWRGWTAAGRAAAERFDVGEAQELVEAMLAGAQAVLGGTSTSRPAPGGVAAGETAPDVGVPWPGPLRELADRSTASGVQALRHLVHRARLDRPVLVDVATAQRMVAPVAWTVNHIGVRGVPLTSAGYLRPADVEAVAHALRIGDEWIGTLNREAHTYPVLLFREALQRAGLLRVARGRLHASRAAAALVADPVGLWRHVAERLPVGRGSERDAGLLVLLEVAGADVGGPGARDGVAGVEAGVGALSSADTVVAAMAGLGWVHRHGAPLSAGGIHHAAEHTVALVRRCGALVDPGIGGRRTTVPTPEGVALARAALQTWR